MWEATTLWVPHQSHPWDAPWNGRELYVPAPGKSVEVYKWHVNLPYIWFLFCKTKNEDKQWYVLRCPHRYPPLKILDAYNTFWRLTQQNIPSFILAKLMQYKCMFLTLLCRSSNEVACWPAGTSEHKFTEGPAEQDQNRSGRNRGWEGDIWGVATQGLGSVLTHFTSVLVHLRRFKKRNW